MEQRLSVVTLGVEDLTRARRFYEHGLGWETASAEDSEIVFFQIRGSVLGLYPRGALAEDACIAKEGSGFGGITLAYNARSRQEVDDVLAEAAKAGATVPKPAGKVLWGGYSGYFIDPDGHPWEVAWNPHWTLGEDGSITLPAQD